MANPTGKGGFQERKHQINRNGRPKDSQSLSALIRRIGHEIATTKDGQPLLGPDGRPMTVVEAVIRQRFQDKRYQGEMLDRGWGKVPMAVEHTGKDGGAIKLSWGDDNVDED